MTKGMECRSSQFGGNMATIMQGGRVSLVEHDSKASSKLQGVLRPPSPLPSCPLPVVFCVGCIAYLSIKVRCANQVWTHMYWPAPYMDRLWTNVYGSYRRLLAQILFFAETCEERANCTVAMFQERVLYVKCIGRYDCSVRNDP